MAAENINETTRVQSEVNWHPLTIPKLPARDSLTDEQFNAMMKKGYDQAKSGEGLSAAEAFADIKIIKEG